MSDPPIVIFPWLLYHSGLAIIPMFWVIAYKIRFLKASLLSKIRTCYPYGIVNERGISAEIYPGYLSTMLSKMISCPRGLLFLSIFLYSEVCLVNLALFISRKGTRLMRKNV